LDVSEFNVVSCNTLSILSSPALLTVTLVLPVASDDRDVNSSTGCCESFGADATGGVGAYATDDGVLTSSP
jgi:hypothetical protein